MTAPGSTGGRPGSLSFSAVRRRIIRSRAVAPSGMRRAWVRHHAVLHTAAALLGTTVVTSGLGLLFWGTATRLLPPTAVGYGSAAVNVMTAVGTVGMLGLGTMLIGELRGGNAPQPGLVTAALVVTGVASFLIGSATLAVIYAGNVSSFGVTDLLVDALFLVG